VPNAPGHSLKGSRGSCTRQVSGPPDRTGHFGFGGTRPVKWNQPSISNWRLHCGLITSGIAHSPVSEIFALPILKGSVEY
jgi:hypothetical protein